MAQSSARPTGAPRRVIVVGYAGAEALDIACVVSTLQIANFLHGEPIYAPELVSAGRQPIRTATGLTLAADDSLERARGPLDTLVVSGGVGYIAALDDPHVVTHLRPLARTRLRVDSASS